MKTTKKALSILLAVLMMAGCFSLCLNASAAQAITEIVLTTPEMVAGGAFPSTSEVSAGDHLKVNAVVVEIKNGDTYKSAPAPFVAGQTYRVSFTVGPKSTAYIFQNSGLTATVNGKSAEAIYKSNREVIVSFEITILQEGYHTLTLVADPPEAATEFTGAGIYKANSSVRLIHVSFDPFTYLFLGWYDGDNHLSDGDDNYFDEYIYYYKMPDHDVTLTAKFTTQTNTGTDGDLTWTYDPATKTLTIGGSGIMNNYGDEDAPWTYTYSAAKKIVIENGVTSIGNQAFYGFSKVESVSLPESVKSIGERAFVACSSLNSITLPNGLNRIDQQAFSESGLTRVTIPGSVKTIGNAAFMNCNSLEEVIVEDGVKNIGASAFSPCSYLTTVSLPASIREIGGRAFEQCPSLETINYAGSEDDWNKIVFGEKVFGDSTNPKINCKYTPPQPVKVCHWCGKDHSNGFFQKVIGFFHSILAFFFGKKY